MQWTHPCARFNDAYSWNLQAFVAVAGSTPSYTLETSSSISKTSTVHGGAFGGFGDYITNTNTTTESSGIFNGKFEINTGDNPHGYHTRLGVTTNGVKTRFLTVLWPYRCGTNPPAMVKHEAFNHAYITIEGIEPFNVSVVEGLSVTRNHGGEDITNPLGISTGTPVLKVNAENFTYAVGPDSLYFGESLTQTTFRYAGITEGRFMIYDGDTIISSDTVVSSSYNITGKNRYSGYVKKSAATPNCYVSFLIDDCSSLSNMMAEDNNGTQLTSVFDTTHKLLKIYITDSLTQFVIRLQDPCSASDYFPTILDTTLELSTGAVEYLGHDMKIIQTDGHLIVNNGSKINICKDYSIINEDSLTLKGLWTDGDETSYPYRTNYNDETGAPISSGTYPKHAYQRLYSKKSMIVVNNKAALILDSASYTKVEANATILIRKGGTLLIKDSATLEIGSSASPGNAEIIAEDSAFVCIENGARIKFYADPNDSSDKNVFYVSMHPTKGTVAGTNTLGANGKFISPSGAYHNNNCTPICDIQITNNFNSVYNGNFGWSNFRMPQANITLKDTFCQGDSITVFGIRTLHETKYHFQICQYNSNASTCMSGTSFVPSSVMTTGHWDSIRISEKNLSRYFTFLTGFSYKIDFIIKNDCNQPDTVTRIIYIAPSPVASFSLADSACPGYNTITLNGSASTDETSYTWWVSDIRDLGDIAVNDENNVLHEIDSSVSGTVPSSFTFSDYRFNGGVKYQTRLSVSNKCGTHEKIDTINIPLSARIITDTQTVYSVSAVKLTGRKTGATSFLWEGPLSTDTNSLDTTIIKTITGTAKWRFIVHGNGCHDTDSVILKLNSFANAGRNDTICKGDSVLVGINSGTLPPNYTYNWSPATSLSASGIRQPWAKPDTTTIYTLIIKDGSNIEVERDEVTVTVDSLSFPEFGIIDDLDTLAFRYCFLNLSNPSLPTNSYSWNFGDGSAISDSVNPCHMYPNFGKDTFFVICLTVSNACGDSIFCDTLYMDSTGVVNLDSLPDSAPFMSIDQLHSSEKSALVKAIPNPAAQRTIIEYSIAPSASKAKIYVTDNLGVLVKVIELNKKLNGVEIDCSAWPKGIYYYALIVDGLRIETQKLSIH